MSKIAIALFFVLPLFAQPQRSDYCFANKDDAQEKLNAINKYCSDTYGSGAGFEGRINVSSGQYCASAVCKGCSGLKVTDILDAYRKQCCIMGMEYSFNSNILCSESSFNGGGWGFTEPRVSEIYFDPSVMCRSSGLAFDKQQCKFIEKSSSSVSDGRSSNSIDDAGSSSSGDGGSSSSSEAEDDEPDDDNDFGLCFSSLGDAITSNLLRRSECVASGGDISDMEVVLHPQDLLWCLVGSCDVSSSSSSSGGGGNSSGSSHGGSWCATHPESVCCPEGGARNCECGHGTSLAYRPADADGICDYGAQVWRCLFDGADVISAGGSPCSTNLFLSSSISNASSSSSLKQSSSSTVQSSSSLSSNSSSSAISSSSAASCSSSGNSSSSSSGNGVSSSAVNIYDFCRENPNNYICLGFSSNSVGNSSSSQGTPAKHNERGPSVVYTADDIFNSGLDNMAQGKCYSLNPDREQPQIGWINNNAQDKWWWVERPCDGSALVEPVTPNGCKYNNRGINAVYTANDCFSGGLDNMEPGKCYSLNPDREQPQIGWINNDARDRWWWVEVSCGLIFLPKKDISESNSGYIQYDEAKLFYDAAGRKTEPRSEIRRFLFSPKKKLGEGQKSK